MPIKECLTCTKSFYVKPVELRKGKGKYCSRQCYGVSIRGSRPDTFTTRVYISCPQCGNPFFTYPKRISKNRGKFCSKACAFKSRNKRIEKNCKICNKIFTTVPSQVKLRGGKYCSRKCFAISQQGCQRPNRIKAPYRIKGYVWIYKPSHPKSNKMGYVSAHRFIYEKFLGRPLTPTEVIHHINKDKDDNRIENLSCFENNSLHMKYHRKLQKLSKQ